MTSIRTMTEDEVWEKVEKWATETAGGTTQTQKEEKLSLEIKDSSGNTIRKLKAGGDAGLHLQRWDLRRDRRKNDRFGGAAKPGQYQVVLSIGDKQYTSYVLVKTDPQLPEAPTMLEFEEQAYETMMKKMKSLELTD